MEYFSCVKASWHSKTSTKPQRPSWTPEADLIQLTEAATEVAEVEENITEAVETADTLEDMAEAITETVEEGGVSEPEAEALRIAVEHMCVRIGFPKSVKVFPAMEGFKDKTTRVSNTKIALEEIGAKVKQIWEQIVAVFKKAVEWVIKFYKHATDLAAGLAARAEKLGALAAAKAGKGVKEGATVKTTGAIGGFGKVLQSGGKVAEGSAFVKDFEAYVKSSDEINKAQAKLTLEGQKSLNDMMAAITNEGFEGKVADAVKTFNEGAVGKAASGAAGKDLGGEGLAVHAAPLAFGDRAFYSTVVSDSGKAAELVGKIKFQVGPVDGAKDLDEKQETVAPMSPEDVVAVTGLVKSHMDTYKDFGAEVKAVEEALASIEKAMKETVKADDKDGKAGANSGVATKVARAYISAATSGASSLRKYDITVCKGALDYSAASLKAIEAPAAKEEPAAA